MTIPRYIIDRYVRAGGARLPRRQELLIVAGICPECSKAVYSRVIGRSETMNGIWLNGDKYHHECFKNRPLPNYRALPSVYQEGRRGERHPKGNLDDAEYRYWVGTREAWSAWAECRCCKKSTYSLEEREKHLKDPSFAVGGERCSTRLVNAYKLMLDSEQCLVCKGRRWMAQKWGVPLCSDPRCIDSWRFEKTHWAALELQLKLQQNKADFLAKKKGDLLCGIKPIIASSQRSWCTSCSMWMDSRLHDEEHQKRVNRGDIYAD
jgi:hypothetical protein